MSILELSFFGVDFVGGKKALMRLSHFIKKKLAASAADFNVSLFWPPRLVGCLANTVM